MKTQLSFASLNACSGHWLLAAKGTFQLKWAYEPSAYIKNLVLNFPHLKLHSNIDEPFEYADVIAGSPPCSGICAANPGRRADHPANLHMLAFAKRCAELQPQVALMEESDYLAKPANTALRGEICSILRQSFDHVEWNTFNFGDMLNLQDRKRILIVAHNCHHASTITGLLPHNLARPAHTHILGWHGLLHGIKPITYYQFDVEKMPFKSARRHNFFNRIITARPRFFSITGTSNRDIIFAKTFSGKARDASCALRKNEPKPNLQDYRFASIEELACIMGLPADYKYAGIGMAWKVGTIARGVPVRETSIILRRVRKCLKTK
jgi:site-specific DNA-cytosine methylase